MSKNKKTLLLNGCFGRMGYAISNYVRGHSQTYISIASEWKGHKKIGENLYPSTHKNNPVVNVLPNSFDVDYIIDFSEPNTAITLAKLAAKFKTPYVTGTTGFSSKQILELKKISKKIPVLQSYNMSLGINLILKIIKENSEYFNQTDLEIIEKHHNQKIDSPSGTALLLANAIGETRGKRPDSFVNYRNKSNNLKRKKNEVGISVVRGGNTVGEHSLISYSDFENITLTHEALDRSVFAKGAVELGLILIKKRPGFYSVLDLL
tara:strand:- start:142 stop:933 length:792 start_codon:yes stop_codon:yes gene_type:complete